MAFSFFSQNVNFPSLWNFSQYTQCHNLSYASNSPGVTIKPANHGANLVSFYGNPAQSPLALMEGACSKEYEECSELLQSSFDYNLDESAIYPSTNGFVHSVIEAYSSHHHLRIRPEDVWFAVLSQLGFYINAHAEELRGQFVAHKGKKTLEVKLAGSRYTVDFGRFAKLMSDEIEKNVVDPELKDWILPAFSTTIDSDIVVASVLLMGAVQKYFEYKLTLLCGLPSVTLLGEKADWELILKRLDKLETFGAEPTQFCALLRPVVSRFIKSFDEPDSEEVISFWQRIAHADAVGSGSAYYSGWITAFCFWDRDGKKLYVVTSPPREANQRWETSQYPNLVLDEAVYHILDSEDVPPGFSSVPVKVDDNGYNFEAVMIAGSVGINCTSSGEKLATAQDQTGLDTVAPESGWWIFEKKSADVIAEEQQQAIWGKEEQRLEMSNKWDDDYLY